MAICENDVSLVAPCQCLSPAGMKIKVPGVTVISSFSVATIPVPSVTYKTWSNVWVWNTFTAPGLKFITATRRSSLLSPIISCLVTLPLKILLVLSWASISLVLMTFVVFLQTL